MSRNQRKKSFKKPKPTFKKNLQKGIVKRHPDGFGFFIPEDSSLQDAYVPRESMSGVMSGDTVEVDIQKEPGGKRFRGFIKKIISRKFKTVSGPISFKGNSTGVIRDESFVWGEDLYIKNVTPSDELKEGDFVIAEILSFPQSENGFCGKITEVLGDVDKANMDAVRVLNMHQIPYEFSPKCIQESKRYKKDVSKEDYENRKDERDKNYITIDGPTAKDFDDAINIEKTDSGYKLFVAIADVSHYVKPQSALDEEALLRGNSTYFPNFVAPMLPENLSNELCSLKPNVDRLAFVAEMSLSDEGEIQQTQFYESVICSKSRVTYGEAQDIIEGVDVPKHAHVADMIKESKKLADILMKKRFREGALDMNVPEIIVSVDGQGEPQDIQKSVRLFAHRMIEEFMLIANVSVARFFTKREINAIFRVHDQPRNEGLELLKSYLGQLGEKINDSEVKLQTQMTNVLEKYKGTVQEHILSILTLRSMSQAEYSANNIGHFGLAFENYTHFTSPIRRYADLIVHRLLKASLMPHKGYMLVPEDKLQAYGTVLSGNEQRSVKAERQIDAIKKARFMKRHMGEEFQGIISSVTKFGIFVMLKEYAVDGLVKIEFLAQDLFEFDPQTLQLRGQKTGVSFSMGDEVSIVVSSVDTEQGQIDFVLDKESLKKSPGGMSLENNSGKKKAPGRNSQKRKSNKKDSGSVRKKRVRKPGRKSKAR